MSSNVIRTSSAGTWIAEAIIDAWPVIIQANTGWLVAYAELDNFQPFAHKQS